jgi:hypothetical protein
VAGRKPKYALDEYARRGEELYATIRAQVDPGNDGKILAIDIETGEYEVDSNQKAACDRLFARLPDPQIYCLRIGWRSIHSFGGSPQRRAS